MMLLITALLLFVACGSVHPAPEPYTKLVTDYDKPFTLTCKKGEHLVGLYSEHDNHFEDRKWTLHCINYGSVTLGCKWFGPVNKYDEDVNFVCPGGGIISGLQSVHDNHKEDRRWKVRCCKASRKYAISACKWTGWVNKYDEKLSFFKASKDANLVITGMKSHHDNHAEDRQFKFQMCRRFGNTGRFGSVSTLKNTPYDKPFHFKCGDGENLRALFSKHSNHHEDRTWTFQCKNTGAVGKKCRWFGWLNKMDGPTDFTCPHRGIISGILSYHNNHYEDRQWKLRCCLPLPNVILNRCARTKDFVNKWDKFLAYQVKGREVITGMRSMHNNYYEDRRFGFTKCQQGRAKPIFYG